jgi:molecular chaperone GrpE (heat shock protein)
MGVLGTLGSLNVLLSADTTTFTSSMEKAAYVADRNLSKIAYKGRMTVAAITAAAAASATALAVAVNKSIQHADNLGKMAQAIGLTVEQLSTLAYAAKLSGLGIEELRVAFQKFDKSIFEASRGSKEQADTFKMLGISIKDAGGSVKNNYDLFLESATALSHMKDGAEKTALAMALFGKSGAGLLPLLNGGKEGIQKFTEEAKKLGLEISTGTAKSAEIFNDNMTRLSQSMQGMINKLAEGMLPSLQALSENMTSSSLATENFSAVGNAAGKTLLTLATILETTVTGYRMLGLAIKGEYGKIVELDQKMAANRERMWKVLTDSETQSADTSVKTIQKHAFSVETATKAIDKETEAAKRLQKAADGIGQAFGTAFENAIIEGAKFHDLMMSLLQDIERALLRSLIVDPLVSAISSGAKSFLGSFLPGGTTKSEHGNIFSHGSYVPFASGGLITRPTLFPMANGGTGLAGEAGTEAIMPLFRTPGGDLGVKSGGGKVEVNVYAPAGSKVSQSRQQSGDMEQINIMIDEAVAGSVNNPGSRTHRALKTSFGLRQSLTTR